MIPVPAPDVFPQFFNATGTAPLVGGLLFTYIAGTSTKQATYTDATGLVLNANPIILDSAGMTAIWIDPSKSYKFVLAPANDTDPPQSPLRTQDNVLVSFNIGNALYYPQTLVESAASVMPTQFQYAPYNAFRYMTAAQVADVQAHTTLTDVTLALQTLFTLCGANCYLATLPAGKYKISSPLTFTGADGGGIYMEGCGEGQQSTLLVTGTGYTALTVCGCVSHLEISIVGTGNACNGLYLGMTSVNNQHLWLSTLQYVRVYNLAGFGVCANDWWDVLAHHISVQSCGTAAQWAFSLNNVSSGSSESVITRLQVELSNFQAINIGTVMSCHFTKIHSERTVGSGANTHGLGGDSCVYGAVRIEGGSNDQILLDGSNCDYHTLRASNAAVTVASPFAAPCRVGHISCTSLSMTATNIAPFDIEDGGIIALTVSYQGLGVARFRRLTIGTVSTIGGGFSVFDNCTITGAWTNTGNTTADLRNCTLTAFPTAQALRLDNCTIAGGLAPAFNQLIDAWKCTFANSITFTPGNNAVFIAKNGCVFNAALVGATGNNYGILDATCTVGQGVTVGTDWYGTPLTLPAILGQWAQGTQRWNPLPAAAGSIAMICTAGSTTGPGTWTGLTLP